MFKKRESVLSKKEEKIIINRKTNYSAKLQKLWKNKWNKKRNNWKKIGATMLKKKRKKCQWRIKTYNKWIIWKISCCIMSFSDKCSRSFNKIFKIKCTFKEWMWLISRMPDFTLNHWYHWHNTVHQIAITRIWAFKVIIIPSSNCYRLCKTDNSN